MKLIKIKGMYTGLGKIVLENKKTIDWDDLTEDKPVFLPFGSKVELVISFDENDFLSGKDGVVWATYDSRQVEVVQNTLLAQNINCEIKKIKIDSKDMFLIAVTNERDMKVAIDFIWEGNNGLRLKPDWSYGQGETNKSFEQWLNGH